MRARHSLGSVTPTLLQEQVQVPVRRCDSAPDPVLLDDDLSGASFDDAGAGGGGVPALSSSLPPSLPGPGSFAGDEATYEEHFTGEAVFEGVADGDAAANSDDEGQEPPGNPATERAYTFEEQKKRLAMELAAVRASSHVSDRGE